MKTLILAKLFLLLILTSCSITIRNVDPISRVTSTEKISQFDEILVYNITAHTPEVWAISWSPSGELIASAGSDGINLWNFTTGELVKSLDGHTSTVQSIMFSPNGEFLVSGSLDNTVLIWNVQTGVVEHNLTDHTSSVRSVDFSPNGKLIASCSQDNSIKIWNATTGDFLFNLTGHTDDIRAIKFIANTFLASGSYDNTIRIWDLELKTTVRTFNTHTENINGLDNGEFLASASSDQTVKLWDLASTTNPILSFENHTGYVRSVSIHPDGYLIASGSVDKTIKIWDVNGNVGLTLDEHAVSVNTVTFSPDGNYLCSGGSDSKLKVWNVTDIDFDGLLNSWEWENDLNPINPSDRYTDPDSDLLTNIDEFILNTDPQNPDSDGDIMIDGYEITYGLDPLDDSDERTDLDNDGMDNRYEFENGLLVSSNDSNSDLDHDGIPNLYEYTYGLLVRTFDSDDDLDGDGMTNLFEYRHNLKIDEDDADEDLDNDELSNLEEFIHDTFPRDSDSDNDGFSDGMEVNFGTNPRNFLDNPLISILRIITILGIIALVIIYIVYITPRLRIRYNNYQQQQELIRINAEKTRFLQKSISDLKSRKAISIESISKSTGINQIDIPKEIKKLLTRRDININSLVLRSQMLMLEECPPKEPCQIHMSELEENTYLQCNDCKRYVCLADYVNLKELGRDQCPNCSGSLVLFRFTCSGCGLDFSAIDDISHSKDRCHLCGYSLPDQKKLIEKKAESKKPSDIIDSLMNEKNKKDDLESKKGKPS